MKKSKKDGRRKFLDKGLKLGALTALGGLGISKIASGLNRNSDDHGHEKMELMTTNGDLVLVDTTEVEEVHHATDHDEKYNIREGMPNRKFVMVIDLAKCRNARKCIDACQQMHHLPAEDEWIRVYYMQDSDDTAPYWFPKPCFH